MFFKLFKLFRIPIFFEGEGAGGGGGDDKTKAIKDAGGFTQDDVNRVVQERLAREKDKYKDYDTLKTFKDTHDKDADAQKQKDLESSKQYDEAKAGLQKQITDLQGVVAQKDTRISGMMVSHNLTNELMKQNAYVEESLALLQALVVVGDDGVLTIKGKKDNIDTQLTIEEGVKDFLAKRPHLVKANPSSGGGTPSGGPGGGAGSGAADLAQLNQEYVKEYSAGNYKRAAEIKKQIATHFTSKGIQRTI